MEYTQKVKEVTKILIDLQKLSNLNCGLGQVALNFGKAISEIETNLELNFLLPNEFIGYFGNNVNYFTSKTISASKKIFDVWHSIHQEPSILPEKETEFLMTIHDLNFLGEKNERKANKRLKDLQKLVNQANHLCFISEFSQNSAIENLELNSINTQVIYNGVSTKDETAEPLIKPDRFFFSIGVFKEKKNFHILIPVMKDFPEHQLIIAGENKGPYYKEILKTIRKERLESQVLFPGIISEENKAWYYKNCDVFLFPSLHEGFGLPVIEAMRYGVPVITSNSTSLPEVGGGFTHIFKDLNQATIKEQIEKGISTYKIDSEFKSKAIEYSKTFNWKENAQKYLDVYSELSS